MIQEAKMKKEIQSSINRYRNLWVKYKDYRSTLSVQDESKVFFARHFQFTGSESQKNSRYTGYSDDMYDSVFDCLACYRWYIIPDRLRRVSGLVHEIKIEKLLDAVGYSTSLIAEELFLMIDICLESGRCSGKDLQKIRLAFNGLSGFQDPYVCSIVQWGLFRNKGKFSSIGNIDIDTVPPTSA